jgi:hypothetical protein
MANKNTTVLVQSAQTTGFARWQIFKLALSGLDYFAAFVGTEISDKLVCGLRAASTDIVGASLGKARSDILLVEGRKLFAWPVKTNGDVYERTHKDENGEMPIRGSVKVLQAAFGAKAVRFVSLKELMALAQRQKMDKDCATALGIEIKAPNTDKASTTAAKAKAVKGKDKAVKGKGKAAKGKDKETTAKKLIKAAKTI